MCLISGDPEAHEVPNHRLCVCHLDKPAVLRVWALETLSGAGVLKTVVIKLRCCLLFSLYSHLHWWPKQWQVKLLVSQPNRRLQPRMASGHAFFTAVQLETVRALASVLTG